MGRTVIALSIPPAALASDRLLSPCARRMRCEDLPPQEEDEDTMPSSAESGGERAGERRRRCHVSVALGGAW